MLIPSLEPCRVTLRSVWQASLFLRSISSECHAARHPLEDSEGIAKNSLASFVRELNFEVKNEMSHARGGASVFIDIVRPTSRLQILWL